MTKGAPSNDRDSSSRTTRATLGGASHEIDIVVVVQFRGNKLASERIYWDHAAVLRQVGLLTS